MIENVGDLVDAENMTALAKHSGLIRLVESLESRRHLSAVDLTDGVLTITGDTASANIITLTHSRRTQGLRVRAGAVRQLISTAGMTSIRIIGGDMTDRVRVGGILLVPMDVRTGPGNDFIRTGAGNDYIDGGAGTNVIRSGLGDDVIKTQDNGDLIYSGPGSDTIVTAFTQKRFRDRSAVDRLVAPVPNDPTDFVVTAASASEVDLSWRDNSAEEVGFVVSRSTDGSEFQPVATVAKDAASYRDTSLAAGTTYYYRVAAVAPGDVLSGFVSASAQTGRVILPGAGFAGPTPQPAAIGDISLPGYDAKAIARWDVVPHQTFTDTFNVGVVAFHMNGIDRVEFSLNGGDWTAVRQMSLNPETDVYEYWATLNAATLPDGPVEVRAVAYPKVGVPRVLESLQLNANGKATLSRPTFYVKPSTGADSNPGTSDLPFDTLARALRGTPDGAMIVLVEPGRYNPDRFSEGGHTNVNNSRWITVRAADGLSADQVVVARDGVRGSIRPRVAKLQWEGVTFDYDEIAQYYPEGGHNVWFDRSRWITPSGWTGQQGSPQPVRALAQIGGSYVTDSVAEDMLYGFVDQSLVRNSQMLRISGDALQNSRMVLNVLADTVGGSGIAHHADLLQYFGNFENVIVYGLDAKRIASQNFFFDWNQTSFKDCAYVDISIENLQSEANKPPYSQMYSHQTHVLFERVRNLGQHWLFRDSETNLAQRYTPINVVYRNSDIQLLNTPQGVIFDVGTVN